MATRAESRPGVSPLPRRRNGKEQACEPCRKAKIACDHTIPICTRCKRRKVPTKCVYLAAPMTRPSDGTRRQSEPALSNFPLTPITGSINSPAGPAALPPTSSTTPASDSGQARKLGSFFGPTSFSAVFAENRENLGSDEIQISNDSEPSLPPYESLQSQNYLMLSGYGQQGSPRISLGVKVLRALPDQNTCNFLLEWWFDKGGDSLAQKRTVLAIASSIWRAYGKQLKEPRRTEGLEEISRILCRNAEIPLDESDDFETWIASLSGLNLRWESLGVVFGGMTSSILSLPERDAFFSTQRGGRSDRKFFAVELQDCVQACITLSNYMDLLNTMMVTLLSKNLVLQTVISGDTSLVCWRQLGDLVSATTALGLHRQVDKPISFLTEMKKYIFTVVFNIDKGSAFLTGRPPALSFRYTRFELPLDLNDDVTIRGGEELKNAVSALDSNGWNTEGKIYTSSRARCFGLLAIVLNEVLEMSLGDPADCTGDRIKYLLDQLEKTYFSLPVFLRYDNNDPATHKCSDQDFWRRLSIRMTMLEYRLLLERQAHKHNVFDGQSMVDCAREMLELVVLIWVQRDRFVEHHCDYDWMLMCWGVPSSGVLCVELLKQMKQPFGTPHTPQIPRSEIVQNLSLLIGFLEWIRPAAGNYQLCRRMRLLIKRILDQILNPSMPSSLPATSQEPVQSTGQTLDQACDNGAVPFDPNFSGVGSYEDGLDNLDWLNNVDWSRGSWQIDLGGQDFSAARWS